MWINFFHSFILNAMIKYKTLHSFSSLGAKKMAAIVICSAEVIKFLPSGEMKKIANEFQAINSIIHSQNPIHHFYWWCKVRCHNLLSNAVAHANEAITMAIRIIDSFCRCLTHSLPHCLYQFWWINKNVKFQLHMMIVVWQGLEFHWIFFE